MGEKNVPTGESQAKGKQEENSGSPENDPILPPSFGFDEKGTFHLQVDSRLGFLNILGALQRSISYVNGAMNQQEAKDRQQREALVRPGQKIFNKLKLFN